MHDTSITVPKSLAKRIAKWRYQINVSQVCVNALRREMQRLDKIQEKERPRPRRRPRREKRYVNVRIEYPEAFAERLAPYKPYMNISAVCSEAIEAYLTTLENLPENVQRMMLQQGEL
jgi:post-segregation antitoxin (ccd killing protein)